MDRESNPEAPKAARKTRSRFTPELKGRMRLEERDAELLCDLFLHRLMSRGQLERLYFTSASRCNVRLRQLFDHGLVERYYPPLALYGAQCIYSLGKAGVAPVARRLDWDRQDVERQAKRHKTPQFLEHTLAINGARLDLRDALARAPEWDLERWLPEIRCRHEYDIRSAGGAWAREVFKPDGFARARHHTSRATASFFLEIDMGHTSSDKFADKMDSYDRYLESGLFHEVYGEEGFTTLVITTGPRRLRNLRDIAEKRGGRLFWFATFDDVERHGITNAIWHPPFERAPRRLL